jgi:hypothetical protein
LDSAIEKLKSGSTFSKELIEPWNLFLWMNPGKIIYTGKKPIKRY